MQLPLAVTRVNERLTAKILGPLRFEIGGVGASGRLAKLGGKAVAEKVAFPESSMTALGLRREAARDGGPG